MPQLADNEAVAGAFARDGVVLVEHAIEKAQLRCLESAFEAAGGRRHGGMEAAFVADLTIHPVLSALARMLAGPKARLVRIIAFDKSPEANWFVPWHQDRTVALARREAVAGFDRWTEKDGIPQAEPPISLLEGMVTLRLHLDACNALAGPLEVIPGTHLFGRLGKTAIEKALSGGTPKVCLAARGDILAMRPLLLHRSQRALAPSHRRVLHLEYCAAALPAALQWSLPRGAEPISGLLH
ncbi:MAG: phytanoyl-CoA dioxygenase family protein [Hyphomicrobiaceae bacterium]